MKYTISSTSGQAFEYDLPEASSRKSFFAFGMPKGGSTLLNYMLRDVCELHGIATVDVATAAFVRGIKPRSLDSSLGQIPLSGRVRVSRLADVSMAGPV